MKGFTLGAAWLNLILVALVIFLRRDKEPQSTLMWIMIMTFMPGVGFVLYLFLGQDFRKSKMFDVKLEQDALIDRIVRIQGKIFDSKELENHKDYLKSHYEIVDHDDLINLNLKSDEAIYTDDNDVELFYWGQPKFEALLKDIRNAKESINIQYYIFRSDLIGREIIDALTERARAGVRVRLLVDAVGGRGLRKKDFKEFEEAGGEFCLFFESFFRFINFRLNYRNHRKLVIIDNKIGYIGGFNVGDDYLGRYEDKGPWRDTHIRLVGSSVSGLTKRFIKDWSYAYDGEVDFDEEIYNFSSRGKGNVGVQIITSGPDTEFENIKNAYLKMISEAKEEIIIQSPYFIPDDPIYNQIVIALATGVRVRIMIPGNPDHPFIFPAAIFYLGKLAKLGAEIYLYDYGFIHSKNLIIDDDIASVGSANMDNRSFRLNFEANAVIYDHGVNQSLKDQFEKDVEKSRTFTYEDYLDRPIWLRVREAISKLLSPIL